MQDELSPNITAMVHHFNSLALLVPTEILAEATPQMRAKVISTFIKVGKQLPRIMFASKHGTFEFFPIGCRGMSPAQELQLFESSVSGSAMHTSVQAEENLEEGVSD